MNSIDVFHGIYVTMWMFSSEGRAPRAGMIETVGSLMPRSLEGP